MGTETSKADDGKLAERPRDMNNAKADDPPKDKYAYCIYPWMNQIYPDIDVDKTTR